VGVTRRRVTEPLLQINLSRRRVQQVGAADDVRDALRRVVHHHGQLIGVRSIRALEYEITNLPLDVMDDPPLYRILEFDARTLGQQAIGARCAARQQTFAAGAG